MRGAVLLPERADDARGVSALDELGLRPSLPPVLRAALGATGVHSTMQQDLLAARTRRFACGRTAKVAGPAEVGVLPSGSTGIVRGTAREHRSAGVRVPTVSIRRTTSRGVCEDGKMPSHIAEGTAENRGAAENGHNCESFLGRGNRVPTDDGPWQHVGGGHESRLEWHGEEAPLPRAMAEDKKGEPQLCSPSGDFYNETKNYFHIPSFLFYRSSKGVNGLTLTRPQECVGI